MEMNDQTGRQAAKVLSRVEEHFQYAEHRLFKAGAYAGLARRLKERAWRMLLCGAAAAVVFGVLGAIFFVKYGMEGGVVNLLCGGAQLSTGAVFQATWAKTSYQMSESAQAALAVLGAKEKENIPKRDENPQAVANRSRA